VFTVNASNYRNFIQELALLQDVQRTASVSCREATELLVVDKEVFATVCPRIFDRELEEKVSFLR
jgi:CRP-like cAMP-binding protein